MKKFLSLALFAGMLSSLFGQTDGSYAQAMFKRAEESYYANPAPFVSAPAKMDIPQQVVIQFLIKNHVDYNLFYFLEGYDFQPMVEEYYSQSKNTYLYRYMIKTERANAIQLLGYIQSYFQDAFIVTFAKNKRIN